MNKTHSDGDTIMMCGDVIVMTIECPKLCDKQGEQDLEQSIVLFLLNKLIRMLEEKGFIEANCAGDLIYLFEDYIENSTAIEDEKKLLISYNFDEEDFYGCL